MTRRLKYDYTVPLETLQKQLDGMSEALGNKALNAALSGAAKPLKLKMKANAPRRQKGRLAASISQRSLSKTAKARLGYGDNLERVILVGPLHKVEIASGVRINVGHIAHWIEEGTKQGYTIKPKPARLGRPKKKALKLSGRIFYRKVTHPGIIAQHWMKRSNLATRPEQLEAFRRALVRGIARYANA